ncbi:unnamed protein product [Durusdinium trenchii]|uniref:Uncharacterized protein n=1 Tax=Durusdinium trenchii TaxID=1381693 RepID=A0ABP0JAE2_9DINO
MFFHGNSSSADLQWWWWVQLLIVALYCILASWKAIRWCKALDMREAWASLESRLFTRTFSAVVPEEDDPIREKSYKMQLDGLESEIAYVSLTQVIAPFCLFTVVMSLGRNLDLDLENMGLVFGDTNTMPLIVTGIVWCRGIPPSRMMRISMWLLLAAWFVATLVYHLVTYNWRFIEEVWLNHMVFVTVMSLALQVRRSFIVASMVLHTCFFLSLTLINGSEIYVDGERVVGPSPGSQVLLVSLVVLCINYSQVLSQMVSKKANAEYNLVQAEVLRVTMEKRALDAEEASRQKEQAAILARAEQDAKEALNQAEKADDRRVAAEANAHLIQKMHDAMQNLLLMLCDAVVEVDSELNILDQGKLGLVLYQQQKDLKGRCLMDFLRQEDAEHFKERVDASEKQNIPVSVTMIGSYSMKIRVTVYSTQIWQSDGSCTYVLGICESEEFSQKHLTSEAEETRETDYFSPVGWSDRDSEASKPSGSAGSPVDLAPIQPMEPEEKWRWNGTVQDQLNWNVQQCLRMTAEARPYKSWRPNSPPTDFRFCRCFGHGRSRPDLGAARHIAWSMRPWSSSPS